MKDEIHDLRDEVVELQGRLSDLGREIAKILTAPNTLSAGPKTQSAAVSLLVAPHTTSSIVTHSHPTSSIASHLTGSPSGPSMTIPSYQAALPENLRVVRWLRRGENRARGYLALQEIMLLLKRSLLVILPLRQLVQL